MSSRIISNPARVHDFVSRVMPFPMAAGIKGLGLERDGELVAGVIYEGFNAHNVWMHVATKDKGRWLTKPFLWYCFHYPFEEVGVRRVSVHVADSNLESKRFVERLGFQREATLTGAAPDGGDIGIHVMWRDKCRFLGERYGQVI